MNDENNNNYSAADIERYHKGLMTAAERHGLEKAALDDPFLADAIEGYEVLPTGAETDITLLKMRLNERAGKVVPLKKTGLAWLRIAAAVILIAGAGLVAYTYLFTVNKNEVAKSETGEIATKKDSVAREVNIANKAKDSIIQPADKSQDVATAQNEDIKNDNKTKSLALPNRSKTPAKKQLTGKKIKPDTFAVAQHEYTAVQPTEEAISKNADTLSYHDNLESTAANAKVKSQHFSGLVKEYDKQIQFRTRSLNESAASRGIAAQNNQSHIFRGQVLDQSNNPLPFANVTIVPDMVGTYADAKGNFTLISPDTLLAVQVRSAGYENKKASLQTRLSNNSVVLEPDTSNVPSTVISNRKINSDRRKMAHNVKLEEP